MGSTRASATRRATRSGSPKSARTWGSSHPPGRGVPGVGRGRLRSRDCDAALAPDPWTGKGLPRRMPGAPRPGPSGAGAYVLRRVAMMDRQPVSVGVLEERLKADSRVDHVTLELDTARLELGLGGLEVVDVELDRVRVGPELDAEGVRLHDGEREVSRLELTRGHVSPPLAERKAKRLAVELRGAVVVLRRDGDEVDAVQQLCSVAHSHLPSSLIR